MPITNPIDHETFTVTICARINITVGTGEGFSGARDAGEIFCQEIAPTLNAKDFNFDVESITKGVKVSPVDVGKFVEILQNGSD